MNTLILKLNATGDVVRTTTLLHRLSGQTTWLTARGNVELLQGVERVRCLAWEERELACDRRYDLVINLEDELETAAFVHQVDHGRRFGAYLNGDASVAYTEDASGWFDLSLVSVHGRARADELKLLNRRTYQELVFEGLGWRFEGEEYMIAQPTPTGLSGDVAIAAVAGPVWPMKGWAYYGELKHVLEAAGLHVNVLPRRATLREHMADVGNHRCLVGGDSLPMHLALATRTPCVTLFNCTSPWEIHDYDLQTKIVSPLLDTYFYRRGHDPAATTAIKLDEVYEAVMERLEGQGRPAVGRCARK
jgi:ADP-heptose:LPS heptosyltransferase